MIRYSPDPRVKVIFFSSMMALAFTCKDLPVMAALVAVALSLSFLGDWKRIVLKGLKTMAPLLVVAFLLWSFFHEWSMFQHYRGGVNFELGAFMTFRLFLILLLSLNFIAMVKPIELVKALNYFRLPYKMTFVLSLTLRHLHTIASDYKAIKEAQVSRGLELDKGSLLKRIKNYIPVLTPLFVRGIESAEKLALAMELKSFSLERRRYLHVKPRLADAALMALLLTIVFLAILHYWVGVV